jgi:hypothetical protein
MEHPTFKRQASLGTTRPPNSIAKPVVLNGQKSTVAAFVTVIGALSSLFAAGNAYSDDKLGVAFWSNMGLAFFFIAWFLAIVLYFAIYSCCNGTEFAMRDIFFVDINHDGHVDSQEVILQINRGIRTIFTITVGLHGLSSSIVEVFSSKFTVMSAITLVISAGLVFYEGFKQWRESLEDKDQMQKSQHNLTLGVDSADSAFPTISSSTAYQATSSVSAV